MKWWLVLFLVAFAVALPQEHHVRRVVAHRRTHAVPTHAQAGARIPPPANAPVKRVQAVRVVPANPAAQVYNPGHTVAVATPFRAQTPAHVQRLTSPAIKSFPGIRTLTKEESEALQRQIQQWQIAVVGGQVQPGYPGAPQPPPSGPPAGPPYPAGPAYPAGPGTIWIQVPAGAYPYPPSYPQPGPPAPPSQPPQPAPPSVPSQGTEHPFSEVPPTEEASEGVDPVEEGLVSEEPPAPPPPAPPAVGGGQEPAVPEAPAQGGAAKPPEEGVAPHEEVPAKPAEVHPPEPAPPAGGAPVEGAAPEQGPPAGTTPAAEAPAAEKPGTEAPPAGGGAPAAGGGGDAAPAPGGGGGTAPAPGGGGGTAPAPVGGGGTAPAPGGGGDEQENKLVHCKEPRGQFAHESSCSKYYNCWDDVVVEETCPDGLFFSEEHSYCDYPENVKCEERSQEEPSLPIEEHGGCKSAFASFRSKTNCSEFFVCVYGEPVPFACPKELQYNEELGVCDYSYRVGCQNPSAPPTPPAEPGSPTEAPTAGAPAPAPELPPAPVDPPAPAAEQPSVPDSLRGLPPSFLKAGSPCWHSNVYPLNDACSRVAVCRSGTTSILACPKGMSYDVYKRRCLPYYRARC